LRFTARRLTPAPDAVTNKRSNRSRKSKTKKALAQATGSYMQPESSRNAEGRQREWLRTRCYLHARG
jgi:hypothetical protein